MVDVFVILQKMSFFLFFLTVYLDENVYGKVSEGLPNLQV